MSDRPRTLLEQASEATDLAKQAFASGDKVTGIAAVVLATQLIQLAKILEPARHG